jgi:hypothetical protein
MKKQKRSRENEKLSEAIARAMVAAARKAREVARLHGTPIYVWEKGRVIAKRP